MRMRWVRSGGTSEDSIGVSRTTARRRVVVREEEGVDESGARGRAVGDGSALCARVCDYTTRASEHTMVVKYGK